MKEKFEHQRFRYQAKTYTLIDSVVNNDNGTIIVYFYRLMENETIDILVLKYKTDNKEMNVEIQNLEIDVLKTLMILLNNDWEEKVEMKKLRKERKRIINDFKDFSFDELRDIKNIMREITKIENIDFPSKSEKEEKEILYEELWKLGVNLNKVEWNLFYEYVDERINKDWEDD